MSATAHRRAPGGRLLALVVLGFGVMLASLPGGASADYSYTAQYVFPATSSVTDYPCTYSNVCTTATRFGIGVAGPAGAVVGGSYSLSVSYYSPDISWGGYTRTANFCGGFSFPVFLSDGWITQVSVTLDQTVTMIDCGSQLPATTGTITYFES
ncbi:MAG: hypothetical protein ACYDAY_00970 [Candidatus Dormibacteria bacterium]